MLQCKLSSGKGPNQIYVDIMAGAHLTHYWPSVSKIHCLKVVSQHKCLVIQDSDSFSNVNLDTLLKKHLVGWLNKAYHFSQNITFIIHYSCDITLQIHCNSWWNVFGFIHSIHYNNFIQNYWLAIILKYISIRFLCPDDLIPIVWLLIFYISFFNLSCFCIQKYTKDDQDPLGSAMQSIHCPLIKIPPCSQKALWAVYLE